MDDIQLLENEYNRFLNQKISSSLLGKSAFKCVMFYKFQDNTELTIKWCNITLTHEECIQEKYMSCIFLYELSKNKEEGFKWLLEAMKYDSERPEWISFILKYFSENSTLSYAYYLKFRDFYENKYLIKGIDVDSKLMLDISHYDFNIPFYMIIVAYNIKNFDLGLKMFEIVFSKKFIICDPPRLNIFLSNLQFFIDNIKDTEKEKFIINVSDYLHFIEKSNMILLYNVKWIQNIPQEDDDSTKYKIIKRYNDLYNPKNNCKKLAFICFYGQIRAPEKALESLKELRERLENENYTVKIFSHLWYDYDERLYDQRRKESFEKNKENLDYFLSEYKSTKVKIENSIDFTLKTKKLNPKNVTNGRKFENCLSQMNSRTKVCNILKEYCKEDEISDDELKSFPVFMTRLDFGFNVNSNILKDFQKNPSKLFISDKWKYNDNFIVMNAYNFISFFHDFDNHIKEYLLNNSRIPKVYGWWCPESILMERTIDLGLEIEYNSNIPDKFV